MSENAASDPEEGNVELILSRYKEMIAQCQQISAKMQELTMEVGVVHSVTPLIKYLLLLFFLF